MSLIKHHCDEDYPLREPALTDVQIKTQVLCLALGKGFERAGNPIQAFQAFEYSMRAGLYPPVWALDYLRKAFVKKFEDRRSFDSVLGFSMEGLGSGRHDSPMEQRDKAARNRRIILNVFRLEALGIKRRPACRAVAANYTRHTAKELGERQVASILQKDGPTFYIEHGLIQAGLAKWTDDQRRAHLREFDAIALVKPKRKRK